MHDIITEIWSTARRNKLRTTLTGFAVAWGIFMLIFLLGAGNGLINAVMQNSGKFLDTSMMMGGGVTSKAYKGLNEGRRITLNDKDIHTTSHNFTNNVTGTGAEIIQYGLVLSYKDNYIGSCNLCGTFPNQAEINKKEILYGRFINSIDNEQQRKIIVLSESQAKELMPQNMASLVGKNIKTGDFSFKVVGIYKDDQSKSNDEAYVAFNTLRTMFGRGDKADYVYFSFKGLNTMQENEDFEKRYKASINANHQAAPDDNNAVWIWNRFTSTMQMNTGIGIIHTALWIIGLFTLLSGIVGVSNIMLITVKERTREFGIRKAIGASPASILWLIIVESVIITAFFGYIGMILGIAANEYMDATIGHTQVDSGLFTASMFVNPTVGLDVCVEATLVMIFTGALAGLLPARKAARIRPIEALRAE